jgi:hypothetical protein
MGQRSNIHKLKTIPLPSTRLERNYIRRYVEYFFILHVG